MSDQSTTPSREPAAPASVPEPESAREPARGSASAAEPAPASSPEPAAGPGGSSESDDVEKTGVIDLHDTRAIPADPSTGARAAAPSAPPVPQAVASTTPGAAAAQSAGRDDAWFDVFGDPAESGVPARADSSWGSDRADAIAEQAHRTAYAPPVPDHATQPAQPASPAATGGSSSTAPALPDPSSTGVGLTDPPASPAPRRRRGPVVAAVVGLCLLSGLVGGVAGQLAEDRLNVGGSTLPTPGVGATSRPAGSVANIAATVLPSVVTIKVDGGNEGSATGSGFVVDRKGHVLTNNHVVQAAGSGDIEVVLSSGDTEKATVVGRDASYDLAVLKIGRTDLPPLTLGASSKVVVGDQVIAVGAPLGLDQTVTTGIVSALNRPVTPGEGNEASYINAIQTDAAINPGNSGGPLLDMNGQVIGVNSAIARVPGTNGATGGSIGLGFAIPSDQARRTADQLIATGKATHPIIGVQLDRTYTGEGAQVEDINGAVTPGGPAAKAGVRAGDVIVGFEGKRVRTPDQLIVSIRARAVGDTVTLRVQRDGQEFDLKMTLEAEPAK